MNIDIQMFSSVLYWSTSWTVTACSHLEYYDTSFARLDLGIFCFDSLQILSSSVRLHQDNHFQVPWDWVHQDSLLVTQGHSYLSLSHVCVVSAVCTFIMMDKGEFFWPSLLALWIRVWSTIYLCFDPISFLSTPTSLPVPAAGKNPHIMMVHHCSNGFHVFHREASVSDGWSCGTSLHLWAGCLKLRVTRDLFIFIFLDSTGPTPIYSKLPLFQKDKGHCANGNLLCSRLVSVCFVTFFRSGL